MVSNGIPRADQERLGFIPAHTPQEALEKAFEIAGRGATVAILRHGGEALRQNLTGGSAAIRHPLALISMQRQNSSARSR